MTSAGTTSRRIISRTTPTDSTCRRALKGREHYYSFGGARARRRVEHRAFFFPEFFDEAYVARMYGGGKAGGGERESRNVPWMVAYSIDPCTARRRRAAARAWGEARSEIRSFEGAFPAPFARSPRSSRAHGEPAEPAEEPVETVGGSRRRLCDWEHEATRLGYRSQCDAAYGLSCSRAATTTTVEGVEGVGVVVGTEKYPWRSCTIVRRRSRVDRAQTQLRAFYPCQRETAGLGRAFFERYESPAATVRGDEAGGNPSMNDKVRNPGAGGATRRVARRGARAWRAWTIDRLSDFTYSRVAMPRHAGWGR